MDASKTTAYPVETLTRCTTTGVLAWSEEYGKRTRFAHDGRDVEVTILTHDVRGRRIAVPRIEIYRESREVGGLMMFVGYHSDIAARRPDIHDVVWPAIVALCAA